MLEGASSLHSFSCSLSVEVHGMMMDQSINATQN